MKTGARSVPNQLLREERRKRGWSQKDVATQLGAERYYISRWERGMVSPSPHYRQQLCALFGKDARELGLLSADPGENSTAPHLSRLPARPLSCWMVPYRRNPLFTGRSALLELLHERLQEPVLPSPRLPLAVTGLGGMGKTQVVVEYAYQYRSSYQAILWMRAETFETLLVDCQTALDLLGVPGTTLQSPRLALVAIKNWLAASSGWLLILDNVEDATLLDTLLPTEYGGQILLTTRAHTLGSFIDPVALDTMLVEEGSLLLLRRIRAIRLNQCLCDAPATMSTEAEAIVALLDGLPLALDQAGAYIEETGCGMAAYRERYRARGAELLRLRGSSPGDYQASVMTTLSLSLEKLARVSPAALDLLRLCSLLSSEAIPEEIVAPRGADLGPHLEALAGDLIARDTALAHYAAFLY